MAQGQGRVRDFDEEAGHGTVVDGTGRELFFHCTQVADGSRSISVGAEVSYRVVPGHLGRWEAGELRPVG